MKKLLFWLLSISILSIWYGYEVSDIAFDEKWEIILDKVEYLENVVTVEKVEWTGYADKLSIKIDQRCIASLWDDSITLKVYDKLVTSTQWDVYDIILSSRDYMTIWDIMRHESQRYNSKFRSYWSNIVNIPILNSLNIKWRYGQDSWWNDISLYIYVNQSINSFNKFEVASVKSSCRMLTEKAKIEWKKEKEKKEKEESEIKKMRERSMKEIKDKKEKRMLSIERKKMIYRNKK